MVTADLDNSGRDEVVFDFPGWGICVWRNHTSWEQLHPVSAKHLSCGEPRWYGWRRGDRELRRGHGLWTFVNNTTWAQIYLYDVTTLATADLDSNGKAELIASFPSYGVWAFENNANWTLLASVRSSPDRRDCRARAGAQADLVIDFGSNRGLWAYRNNSVWAQLHPFTSQGFHGGRLQTPMARTIWWSAFAGAGLWRYSNGAWSQLHNGRPGRTSSRPLALRFQGARLHAIAPFPTGEQR